MMRESSHLCSTSRTTVVTSGQGDAKYSGSLYRIFAVSFVEVATAEKQQCLGMLCFHLEELSHHRCKPFIVVCHYLSFYFLFSSFPVEIGLTGESFNRNAKIRKNGQIAKDLIYF